MGKRTAGSLTGSSVSLLRSTGSAALKRCLARITRAVVGRLTGMECKIAVTGPFQANTYAVIDDGRVTVIDPGMGAKDVLQQFFTENGLTLDSVVLTHGHIDHVRDAAALANPAHVPVFLHPDDWFMLDDPGAGVSPEAARAYHAEDMEKVDDLRELTPETGATIAGHQFEVRHCPGHSPGCVILVSDEVKSVFTGDVLFRGSIGRVDLPGSSPAAMRESLRQEVKTSPEDYTCFPGHGPGTTVAAELSSNPYLV